MKHFLSINIMVSIVNFTSERLHGSVINPYVSYNEFGFNFKEVKKDGWELYEINPGYIFYKAIDKDISKVKKNTDYSNVFSRNPSWASSADVAFVYIIHEFGNESGIIGLTVTKPLYMFKLFSKSNGEKILRMLKNSYKETKDDEYRRFIGVFMVTTGYGIKWKDVRSLSIGSDIITKYFVNEKGRKVIFKSDDGETFGHRKYDFCRYSIMKDDSFLMAIINMYCDCDGYLGTFTPSLRHNIFHQEVCICNPHYITEINENAKYCAYNYSIEEFQNRYSNKLYTKNNLNLFYGVKYKTIYDEGAGEDVDEPIAFDIKPEPPKLIPNTDISATSSDILSLDEFYNVISRLNPIEYRHKNIVFTKKDYEILNKAFPLD